MRLRVTMICEVEYTDQEAFEKYGTVEPAAVAHAMQTGAIDSNLRLTNPQIAVVPFYT